MCRFFQHFSIIYCYCDGDTVEDFYKRVDLDETRRKFLDGLKEGREYSPVEENTAVMKKKINWGFNLLLGELETK
jgi:hypothetical protein